MISSVNSLSSNSISLLFGNSAATRPGQSGSRAEQVFNAPTGKTDDLFKAGNAIGKIIEIVAGMNAADTEHQPTRLPWKGLPGPKARTANTP